MDNLGEQGRDVPAILIVQPKVRERRRILGWTINVQRSKLITNIPIDMELYVKKLVSLNPDEFGFIPLDKAIKSYGEYVGLMVEGSEKSFEEWCATEV